MISNSEFGSISFDLPKNQSNVIKVIGVGGGGSNAINHMFKQGIKGVDFIVCNTDSQALANSTVPNKIQLGVNLTEGLGAGANPDVGQQSAIESVAEIEKMLDSNTKMVFITAGMGGGTGTGAAPVIAQLAKERDILTVGIVTIPFQFEGKVRQQQALIGVEKLRNQVDSLIVINNNKLREVYGNLGFKAGFSKADEVLATASRGIAEVITHHYTQNVDLRDAKTVLSNSGTAIMGSAIALGENRAKEAIVSALDSPLLNDNKITGAKNVLLLIVSGTNEITIDEIGEINDHIQIEAGHNANIIMGVGEDETLGDSIAVTMIATGFNIEQQGEIVNTEPKKIIHSLEGEQKLVHDLSPKNVISAFDFDKETPTAEPKVIYSLEEAIVVANKEFEMDIVPTSEFIKNLEVTFEIVSPKVEQVEEEFYFITNETKEINVVEPEVITRESAKAFTFDMPITKATTYNESLLFDLPEEVKKIEVKEAVEVTSNAHPTESGVIKYSLEDYMKIENELAKPQAKVEVIEEEIPMEMNLTVKKVPVQEISAKQAPSTEMYETLDPLEMSIEDTLKLRADERRRKLKDFNYKFNNVGSRVEELEKEPAYRRSGVDLHSKGQYNSASRTSIGMDSNQDPQLRSNNSFLHDNVD